MGYRIAGIHTFGDKGLEIMLDTYAEASQENSVLGRRFALDHGMMVSPAVIQKSAELEVIWSIQGPMFYGPRTAITARQYGEEIGHRWVQPVKSLIESGVKVTYGADTHSDPERHPMFALELYVTRKTHDGRVWGPRERIDRRTGLLMLTRWGAEYVLRENELGSIEEGKLADLVILDRNPLDSAIPDEELSEITEHLVRFRRYAGILRPFSLAAGPLLADGGALRDRRPGPAGLRKGRPGHGAAWGAQGYCGADVPACPDLRGAGKADKNVCPTNIYSPAPPAGRAMAWLRRD